MQSKGVMVIEKQNIDVVASSKAVLMFLDDERQMNNVGTKMVEDAPVLWYSHCH